MPSLWEKFKDAMTGMTQVERDLVDLDREMWQLKRILAWNEEIGRRYFEEDDVRARIASLSRQLAEIRRGLPKNSKLKSGPWVRDSFYNNPRRDLDDHIAYLRKAVRGEGVRPKFPVMDAMMRLRMLEDEYRRLYPIVVVNTRAGWQSGWQPGWQPGWQAGGIAPISPPAWAPSGSSNGSPGWGPPTGGAVPAGWSPTSSDSSSQGWGPPSGSSDSSSPGWGPPSGDATPAGWGPQ